MTERIIPLGITGPTALDLAMSAGEIYIEVDDVPGPHLAMRTADMSGPSADAVRDTSVIQQAQRLVVRVPGQKGGSVSFQGGGVAVFGSLSNVSVINGRVYSDGREITPGVVPATSPVIAALVLPRASRVKLRTQSADTQIHGDPVHLDYEGSSGNLRAGKVEDLDAMLTSGTLTVGSVSGVLDVTLTSGRFSLGAYSGSDARLHMTSGSISMHVTPTARGALRANVTSGHAQITGAGHLDVRRKVTSGFVNIT